jgi:tetratricopeptide (TPR) repeat protein
MIRNALLAAALVVTAAAVYRMASSEPEARAPQTPAPAVPAAEPRTTAPAPEAPQPAQTQLPTAQPAQTQPPASEQAAAPAAPIAAASPQAPSTAAAQDGVGAQVRALVERAHALEQQGKPRQALQLYEQASALDPNDATVLGRLAFGYLNRGENEQASDYAARAVAVDPTSSEGWIVLGAARHALGDTRGARDAYRKCVEVGRGPYVDECRRVAR